MLGKMLDISVSLAESNHVFLSSYDIMLQYSDDISLFLDFIFLNNIQDKNMLNS